MKKLRNRLLAFGTAAFLTANALPLQTAQTAFAAEIAAANRGDVNGDGKKDSDDLKALTTLLGEHVETLFAEEQYVQYDITEDGIIDVRDRYALSQYLSGSASDFPVGTGDDLAEDITLRLTNAFCFPGDDFQVALSFVDWNKDIAAYDITIGFDTALQFKGAEFISDDGQYAAGNRTVKLSGLHSDDSLHRGDIAVLTFAAPAKQDGDFSIQVEGANVFSSDYGIYTSVKPTASVNVQPLYEPVALQAAGIGSKSVSLKWDMPFTEQPVVGYRVFRGGKQIAETSDTFYTDSKLNTDADYEYTVSAVTASGIETAQSQPLTVHTAAPEIVSAEFSADTVSDANSDLTVELSQAVPLSEMVLDIKCPDGKTVSETVELNGEDLSSVSYHWNAGKLADGAYSVHVTVKDTDGTAVSADTTVNVLNHPLEALTLKGEAGGRTAVLTWSLAAEAAVTGYRVYRLNADGKTWEMIAEIKNRDTLSYTDSALTAGTKYTYAVTSIDSSEQESVKSNSVAVTPSADKTAPEITVFKPANGQRVSGSVPVSISAEDESGVKSIRCEISADEGKTWKTLCEAEGDSADWNVDTTKQKDGVYQLRAMATDTSGNESSGVNVISINFDNTAPEQVKNIRTVSVSANAAAIAWDDVADEDFDHFTVIISDGTNTSERTVKDTLGLTLNSLTADTRYSITVYAVDIAGNKGTPSDTFRFVSTSDVTPPSITYVGISSEYVSANSSLTVSISASDPAGVTNRYLDYSQDQKKWTTLSLYSQKDNFVIKDTSLKEGTLYLRAYAKDSYGNTGDPESAQVYTVTVDNTAPKAPGKLTASAEQTANVISWSASGSEDVAAYRLERAVGTDDDDAYTVLATRTNTETFTDYNVQPDGEYYYRLYAIDHAGNLSAAVLSGKVKRTPDTEKPVIAECGLSTGQLTICSAHHTLQIMATDNNKINSITAAYRCKDSDEWNTLKISEINQNSIRSELIVRTDLPESILKENAVSVQVTVTDAAENITIGEYVFQIDDRKAEIKNAAAKTDDKQVIVSWNCPDITGVSAFYLMRKIGTAGNEVCIAMASPQSGVTEYSCTDRDLSVGGSMIYRIVAQMTNGNSVSVTLDPLTIQAIPQAVLDYTPSQVLGASYNYDARESRNAKDITDVTISFGDGTSAQKKSVQNALFTHTYEAAGTYDVTLTVTNASGLSDTKKVSVTVAEPDIMSTVHAVVTKMDGTPAAGAAVYVDVGTDQQSKYVTNANGEVDITCTAGDHEFGVFGSGYLPATKTVTLQPSEKKDLHFSIVEDQLVKADFTVERMTLAEIKAAGINVKDPENCQMVKIDVDLSYTVTSTVTEHIRIYYDRTSGGYTISGGGSGGGGGSGSSDYNYIVKTISHDVKTVVLMRVPVKAQFIKEFFKVDMIVMNNADKGFSLTDCTAALNLPNGLSLVEDTPASEPRVASIGTIEGGSQKVVSWIVRGDRNGDYNFSADFSATLQPFNEPVAINFPSDKPIHVYGQEAATITVNFDPVISGKTLYAEVLVENNSQIDLNELSTDIGNVISDTVGTDQDGSPRVEVYQTRFTDTDGILKIVEDSKSISVLHPGQKFSVVYAIRGIIANSIPGYYRKTESEIKKSSTSGNVKVQVKHIKIANVNDPLYGIAFDPEHDFLLLVKNKNGKAISDASVTLTKNGSAFASGTTDERGRLVVSRGDSDDRYHLNITATGYAEYDEAYDFPNRKSTYMETIVMSGDYENDDFSLTYCSFHEASAGYVPLLTKTYTIDRNADITFSITASTPTAGASYALVQGNHTISSINANGRYMSFTDLKPNQFYVDEPVSIRITTPEGDTFETEIGLNVIRIPANPSSDPGAQALAQDLIDLFSDDQEIVISAPADLKEKAGTAFDYTINFPNLKGYNVDKGTGNIGNIGFNIKIDDNGVPTISFSISNEKKFKIGSVGMNFKILFTLSAKEDIVTNVLDASLTAKVSLSGTATTPEIRFLYEVCYFKVAFTASGEVNASVKYTHNLITNNKDLSLSLGWAGSFTISPRLGIGSDKVLAVQLRGDGILKGEGNLLPTPNCTSAKITGDIYIDVIALSYTLNSYSLIVFDDFQFYPSNSTQGRPPMIMEDGQTLDNIVKNTDNYSIPAADSLPTAGAWNGQYGDGITEMQSGIAAGTTPLLATDGTNTIMVWTVQDAARGIANASYLVFSVYDPETKAWSEPTAVDDNGNADTSPVLCAAADGIRIAYMESGAVFTDEEAPSLSDYAKQLVFKTAKFDAESGTFADFKSIDANAEGGFASSPAFAQAADGTTYLFWTKNENGQIFGNDDSNTILCAKETEEGWDTPTVLAEQLPEIYSLSAGTDAEGNPVCAYVTGSADEEGFVMNNLYLEDLSGNITLLASGDIASPQFTAIPGKDASGLIWYQDGKYCASADLVNIEELCSDQLDVTEHFAVSGDRILFLRNTNKRSEVFSMRFDAAEGTFSAPVSIESGENLYYDTISVTQSGSDTLYAMSRTTAIPSEEGGFDSTRALTGGILGETSDIRIAEPEFIYTDAESGKALPMNISVSNDGTVGTEELTLSVQDASGNSIASDTQKVSIASGASETITFAPVLPAELIPAVYTVSVTSGETDRTPDNNLAELDLSKTDLSIETDITYVGNTTQVTIFANNLSNVPTSAVIHIQPSSAEEETLLLFTDEIAPHSSVYWQLDSADMLGDIYRDFVYVTAEADTADADENNNSDCVIISQSGMDSYVIGDVNLDGKVDLDDALLALTCYSRSVAKQTELGFSYTQRRCADIDKNGTVDVTDAMAILSYYTDCISGMVTSSFSEYLAQEQNGGAKHESE